VKFTPLPRQALLSANGVSRAGVPFLEESGSSAALWQKNAPHERALIAGLADAFLVARAKQRVGSSPSPPPPCVVAD